MCVYGLFMPGPSRQVPCYQRVTVTPLRVAETRDNGHVLPEAKYRARAIYLRGPGRQNSSSKMSVTKLYDLLFNFEQS
jgi:hypothetical protein